jgi:hypothetical protein
VEKPVRKGRRGAGFYTEVTTKSVLQLFGATGP